MAAKLVSTALAAKIIGKTEDYIRFGLQQNRLPFGTAVQTGPKRWSYHVSPKLLSDYTGVALDKIEAMAAEAGEAK